MSPEVHILSYFSLETDLAAEFRAWPEFKSGLGYNVELASGDQVVFVEFVPDTDGAHAYVRVRANAVGPLFDRALGRVTHALAAHSDNPMIDRLS